MLLLSKVELLSGKDHKRHSKRATLITPTWPDSLPVWGRLSVRTVSRSLWRETTRLVDSEYVTSNKTYNLIPLPLIIPSVCLYCSVVDYEKYKLLNIVRSTSRSVPTPVSFTAEWESYCCPQWRSKRKLLNVLTFSAIHRNTWSIFLFPKRVRIIV